MSATEGSSPAPGQKPDAGMQRIMDKLEDAPKTVILFIGRKESENKEETGQTHSQTPN